MSWKFLTTSPNTPLARALIDTLTGCGVACNMVSDTTLLGECQRCDVYVQDTQLHRARWLLAQATFTDEELTFLATGCLSGDPPDP